MNQIPLWKIKRELIRLGVYAKAIPLALIEPLRQWHYDRKRSALITITEGGTPTSDTAAIFLIYQPGIYLLRFRQHYNICENKALLRWW